MKCRFCNHETNHVFIDMGVAPPSNSYLTEQQLNNSEVFYPLKLYICDHCWLVQVDEVKKATEIFTDDYAYYSSTSASWVEHAREYVDMMIERFKLDKGKGVLEIGSNDGYLLQHFAKKGVRCMGVDPCKGAADLAEKKGVPTYVGFFDSELAKIMPTFDLICGINVIAHQPDINDFVRGLRICLSPGGIVTMEFPSLQRLMEGGLFDTIYHEHYSYFSFTTIHAIFHKHGLDIFDVEELDTHGGSLRIYAQHDMCVHGAKNKGKVSELLEKEKNAGMKGNNYYLGFQYRCEEVKNNLLNFLLSLPIDKVVVGYGAAAKASTFLNYCGIKPDLLPVIFDKAPEKVGKFMPGSRIPIHHPLDLKDYSPDYVVIFAWNIKDEIMKELEYIRKWGGSFILPHTMEIL